MSKKPSSGRGAYLPETGPVKVMFDLYFQLVIFKSSAELVILKSSAELVIFSPQHMRREALGVSMQLDMEHLVHWAVQ